MRLNINLASQPYEDARRFMITWSSVLGGLSVILLVLTIILVKHWQNYRYMSTNLHREDQVLQDLNNKQRQGLDILNQASNKDVRDKSEFINSLIKRKEVSWTRIFVDLERLMPSHLRVLGIAPKLKDDKIMIEMVLDGDSRDKAAELARRMERSNVFRDAQIDDEALGSNNGQPDYHFHMTAEYVAGLTLTTPDDEKTAAENSEARGGQ